MSDQQRLKRNTLLAETDYMVLTDTPAPSQAWLDYRQALRDVGQSGFPDSVNWPQNPHSWRAVVITLELQVEEVNSLLQVLGELPSKTGAWPLMMKIKEQAEGQVEPEAESDD